MTEGFFLITAFGLLMWLAKDTVISRSKATRDPAATGFLGLRPRNDSVSIFREGLELFLGLVFLLSIHGLAVAAGLPPAAGKKFFLGILFLLSYLFKWVVKQSDIFFLTLFVFAFVLTSRDIPLFLPSCFMEAAFLAAATALFQLLMEGLRFRLLLFPVPKPLSGLPICLFAAALLTLALSGFAKLIP